MATASLKASTASSACLQKSQGKNVTKLSHLQMNTCRCSNGRPFASVGFSGRDLLLGTRQTTPQTCAAITSPAEINVETSGPADTTVSVFGMGLMGAKMAVRLAEQGFKVTAWNRDTSKAQAVAAECTAVAAHASATDAVSSSRVILLMLSDAAAIRSVILDDAAVRNKLNGKTVLMMSTIGPAESQSLAADVKAAGGEYIEAPVLGSKPEAETGTLQIMVGADEGVESSPAWPMLCVLSKAPKRMGPVGSGAAMKLALNHMIVIETLGFSASLGFVQKAGGNVDAFMETLRASALYAPTFDKKLSKYLSRDFGTANFPTKHLLKDARLFCQEAEGLGLDTRVQRASEAVCATACDIDGLANADYSAVYEAVVYPPNKQ